MLLKPFAIAGVIAGVLAVAPPASAAPQSGAGVYPPGNCQPGTFCVWPHWDHPNGVPTATPSLVTTTEWTGNITGFNYYNYTNRNAEISWSFTTQGMTLTGTECATPGDGFFYVPMTVTKVSWRTHVC
ncbi:hypothetical protein ACQRWP_13605 [Micromonospora trifolii]|uniref:hypothetical protein n=1 Tax=Micromonospora trifolii TaxID=2911208 RepID=UPI003D2EACCA